MPEAEGLRSSGGRLGYTDKGRKSVLAGLFVLGFGVLCFRLARLGRQSVCMRRRRRQGVFVLSYVLS